MHRKRKQGDLRREASAKAAVEALRKTKAAQMGISYETYVARFCR